MVEATCHSLQRAPSFYPHPAGAGQWSWTYVPGAALSGVFPLAMATIPSEIVGPTRTARALSLTMGVSEILGGVLAPSVAGKVADLRGLGMTLWILVGIVVAIIVLGAMLRETAPAVIARRRHAR